MCGTVIKQAACHAAGAWKNKVLHGKVLDSSSATCLFAQTCRARLLPRLAVGDRKI
jgi:hypothetical protein